MLALLFFSLESPLEELTFSSSDLMMVQGANKCLLLKRSELTFPSSPFAFLFDAVLKGVIELPEFDVSAMINDGSKKYSTVAFPVT